MDSRIWKFAVGQRVQFDMGNGCAGTGEVLGLAVDHIVQFYIVLLDRPLPGFPDRAISVIGSTMKAV